MVKAKVIVVYGAVPSGLVAVPTRASTVWEGEFVQPEETENLQRMLLGIASAIKKPVAWGAARAFHVSIEQE